MSMSAPVTHSILVEPTSCSELMLLRNAVNEEPSLTEVAVSTLVALKTPRRTRC